MLSLTFRPILLPQASDLAGVARQTANSVFTLHNTLYSWLRLSDRRRTFSLIARRPSAPQPAPLVRAGGARGVCTSQMPPFLEYPPLPVSPLSGIAHARRQSLLTRDYRAGAVCSYRFHVVTRYERGRGRRWR